MTHGGRDERALRRQALVARASLQRLELAATVDQLKLRTSGARGLGSLVLRAAGWIGTPGAGGASLVVRARPWLVSGGLLALRLLRGSPAARWLVGAAAVGGAVWWVARALRTPEPPPDEDS